MNKHVVLSIAVTGLLLAAGPALGYTYSQPLFNGMWVYDGLITYDHGGLPLTPNALHFNVGAGYLTASEIYDSDGNAEDLGGSIGVIGVPIDVGYAINDRVLLDVTLQVLSTTLSPDEGDSYSAAGLGDVWFKGRYIAPVGDFNLGGRLGVKIPVGSVDYMSDDPPLGDDQMDIDFALVMGTYPDEGFAMNGQVGFRYRMAADIDFGIFTAELKPGTMIYFDFAPGYSWGAQDFQIYVPLGFYTQSEAEIEGDPVSGSEENGFFVGLAPKYGIDANNTLGVKFLYPINAKNTLKSMLFGVTYEAYVPM